MNANKPKKLKLRPEDKVVGIRPRTKRDLFAGCNEPGKEWFHPDAHVFMKTFCRLCKNSDCIRAKGVVDPWMTRMSEQVDYLLNDPQFSDLSSPQHKALAEQAFEDIGRKMQRLEVARERQDWEIPGGPTDGYDRISEPGTTDQFDDAVQQLAKARGKETKLLERPKKEDQPTYFQDASEDSETTEENINDNSLYEYETQYPSEDGSTTYLVALHKNGNWTCACKGFGRWKKCKHLETVKSWYEEQLKEPETQESFEPAPQPKKPPVQDPRLPPTKLPLNTPIPTEGVMLGGGAAPEQDMRQRPVLRGDEDPWSIKKDQVIEPGATVVLKGKK